eukprot:710878-Heterocapsa_arctica.AAC.1
MVKVLRDFRRQRSSPATSGGTASVLLSACQAHAMFPPRWLAGNCRHTRCSRLDSRPSNNVAGKENNVYN